MNACSKYPCGMTTAGCMDTFCPMKSSPGFQPHTVTWPPPTPVGCICPPTSEQTCENPYCPRQNPMKRAQKAEPALTKGT